MNFIQFLFILSIGIATISAVAIKHDDEKTDSDDFFFGDDDFVVTGR